MACSHSFVEVIAIVWALQLVRDENFQSIIVKDDFKIYVDVLNKNLEEACWEIQPLLYSASVLAISFIDCLFLLD